MIFYNGFNLLIDLVLVAVAYVIGHGVGYRKNKPPFQACRFDRSTEMWSGYPQAVYNCLRYLQKTSRKFVRKTMVCRAKMSQGYGRLEITRKEITNG